MIDWQDHYWFTEGACYRLALAIHDTTGWPVCAFWDERERDYDIHAFVKTPRGTYLDIEGEHTRKEMLDRWKGGTSIRQVRNLKWLADWGQPDDTDLQDCDERAIELVPEVLAMAGFQI